MEIRISKSDVFWSYIAQFLQMAAGIIVLPYVLKMLSADEVGMNYIMLTIGSMVALIDFGFAPQFGRNISYIFGGAQCLSKEGVIQTKAGVINWRLLSSMVKVSKKVYFYLSFISFIIMMTLGLFYIYKVTDGFSLIDNSFIIWVVYSFSVFFNLYVSYYNALLTGAGRIKESKIAIIVSRILYLVLSYIFLFEGCGLLGLSIAYLAQPVVVFSMSKKYFYTDDIKKNLVFKKTEDAEEKKLFEIIWFNAKKLGINNLGAYGISRMGIFLAGLYSSLEVVSSYGLMVQLLTAIGAVSAIVLNSFMPQLSAYRVSGDEQQLISKFAMSVIILYILFALATLAMILLLPQLLILIKSSSTLPSTGILVLYSIVILLEQNHSAFAALITTNNTVPFVKAGLIAGLLITISSLLVLKYTSLGIMGLVVCQGICQLLYNNWKWPKVVLDEFNLTYLQLLGIGSNELIKKIRIYL